MNIMTKTVAAVSHPLDPLSVAEVRHAAALVRDASFHDTATKFETIELHYPEKQFVQAWKPGAPFPRQAFVCAYNTGTGMVHECVLDLAREEIVSHREVPGVRTAVMTDEFIACVETVTAHPDFIAAMSRRGITDLGNVQIDPFSAGNFGFENEQDKRIVHCLVYYRSSKFDNGYAHPVEGLNIIYDLNKDAVVEVLDRALVPVPMTDRNYAERFQEVAAGLRGDLKAISISQPDGPTFAVDGQCVEWLNWRFHVEFNGREGLVLNDIRYGGRPVLYRASVAEMVVPYGDPSLGNFRKNAFDVGEYGLGRLANSLKLGCDCRGHIHYFDGILNNTAGEPVVIENAVCMHEEDDGMLWKHTDLITSDVAVRRSRRLVISSIATVGNYEYGFYWNLYLDGSIELDVKLTGIMNTAGINEVSGDKYGTEVSPGVLAQNHLHVFCARLDCAVDGDANTLVEVNVEQAPMGDDNPWGNAFCAAETVLKSELAARRRRNADTERYWKVINPGSKNALGKPVAYRLHASCMVRPFNHEETLMAKRAAFMYNHVWATPYRADERYPAGRYVNQSLGEDTIATWTEADRNIENTDLVLWHTFGVVHIPRLEDFPVQPSVQCGFALIADGFFDGNPTLDIPPSKDGGHA